MRVDGARVGGARPLHRAPAQHERHVASGARGGRCDEGVGLVVRGVAADGADGLARAHVGRARDGGRVVPGVPLVVQVRRRGRGALRHEVAAQRVGGRCGSDGGRVCFQTMRVGAARVVGAPASGGGCDFGTSGRAGGGTVGGGVKVAGLGSVSCSAGARRLGGGRARGSRACVRVAGAMIDDHRGAALCGRTFSEIGGGVYRCPNDSQHKKGQGSFVSHGEFVGVFLYVC